jgi:hypothetical protein
VNYSFYTLCAIFFIFTPFLCSGMKTEHVKFEYDLRNHTSDVAVTIYNHHIHGNKQREFRIPQKKIAIPDFNMDRIKIATSKNSFVTLDADFVTQLLTTKDLGSLVLNAHNGRKRSEIIYTAHHLQLPHQSAFLATIAVERNLITKGDRNKEAQAIRAKLVPLKNTSHMSWNWMSRTLTINDQECNTLYGFDDGLAELLSVMQLRSVNNLVISLPSLDGILPQHMHAIFKRVPNLKRILIQNSQMTTLYPDTFKHLPQKAQALVQQNIQLTTLKPDWDKCPATCALTVYGKNKLGKMALLGSKSAREETDLLSDLAQIPQSIWMLATNACNDEQIASVKNMSLFFAFISPAVSYALNETIYKGSELFIFSAFKVAEERFMKSTEHYWTCAARLAINGAIVHKFASRIMNNPNLSETEKAFFQYYIAGLCCLSGIGSCMQIIQKLHQKYPHWSKVATADVPTIDDVDDQDYEDESSEE